MDSYHSVAETVLNFEKGFRAERNVKPFHIHTTIPQSPALKTKQRVRPTEVMSKDELEKKQLEEAKKLVYFLRYRFLFIIFDFVVGIELKRNR